MKLIDLEPRWYVLEESGPRVGLTFLCPHCMKERLGVSFHHKGHEVMEDGYIRAHHQGSDEHIWTLDGAEDLATLTLWPSVDASRYGHWHGFITAGEAR